MSTVTRGKNMETRNVRVNVNITKAQARKLDRLRKAFGAGTTRSSYMNYLLDRAPSVKRYKK